MIRKKENYRLFTEEISLFIEVCLVNVQLLLISFKQSTFEYPVLC